MVVLRKSLCAKVCVARRTGHFFHELPFLLERTMARESIVIQTLVFGGQSSENEPSEPVTSRETISSICCQNNILQQVECISIHEKPAVFY